METKKPTQTDDKDDLYFDCKDKKWIWGRIIDCPCRRFGGLMHKGRTTCEICGNVLYKGD